MVGQKNDAHRKERSKDAGYNHEVGFFAAVYFRNQIGDQKSNRVGQYPYGEFEKPTTHDRPFDGVPIKELLKDQIGNH